MTNIQTPEYLCEQAHSKSQNNISALVQLITELQQPLLSARQRNKDVVFVNVDEYEFVIDQLLGLIGSLSGDLANAYATVKLQQKNYRLVEQTDKVSRIAREVWALIEEGKKKHNTQKLTVSR